MSNLTTSELIDRMRREIKDDLKDMREENNRRFDGLDTRLGNLEGSRIPKLEVKQAVLGAKVLLIITLISVVSSAFISTLFNGIVKAIGKA